MGSVERFFVGSTSKHVLENSECNVVVIKKEFGGEEEHESRAKIIQVEEEERLRRIEEDGPQEIHDTTKEEVVKAEEEERKRRIQEDGTFTKENINKLVHFYQFQDELVQNKKVRSED